jgi:hypothetical protein
LPNAEVPLPSGSSSSIGPVVEVKVAEEAVAASEAEEKEADEEA